MSFTLLRGTRARSACRAISLAAWILLTSAFPSPRDQNMSQSRLVTHRHFYLRKSNASFLLALSDFLLRKYYILLQVYFSFNMNILNMVFDRRRREKKISKYSELKNSIISIFLIFSIIIFK